MELGNTSVIDNTNEFLTRKKHELHLIHWYCLVLAHKVIWINFISFMKIQLGTK
jgi:hypothetical protein